MWYWSYCPLLRSDLQLNHQNLSWHRVNSSTNCNPNTLLIRLAVGHVSAQNLEVPGGICNINTTTYCDLVLIISFLNSYQDRTNVLPVGKWHSIMCFKAAATWHCGISYQYHRTMFYSGSLQELNPILRIPRQKAVGEAQCSSCISILFTNDLIKGCT